LTRLKKTQRGVPIALKQVRKEIPPPTRAFKEGKKYNRKKAKEELKRSLEEKVLNSNRTSKAKQNRGF